MTNGSFALIPFAIATATVASYGLGWWIGIPHLVPVLNMLAGYPFMVAALRGGSVSVAAVRMLIWALTMGACATLLSYARPAPTEMLFLHSAAYRAEMFTWIRTGAGAESDPSRFVPQQLGQATLLVALALSTGGLAAMTLGAVLMNYMGHYVGALGAASAHPAAAMLLAWTPWALARVAGFVTLGVVMSMPLAAGTRSTLSAMRQARPLLAWAISGLLVDITLKWLLASVWHRLLLRVVDW